MRRAARADDTPTAINSREADDRHEHVGIVRDEITGLRDQRHVAALRVAERREHRVPGEEPHRREAVPAVPDRQAVEPDLAFEPRNTRHQQELDQHRVRAGERGELAGRGRDTARPARSRAGHRGGTTARASPRALTAMTTTTTKRAVRRAGPARRAGLPARPTADCTPTAVVTRRILVARTLRER